MERSHKRGGLNGNRDESIQNGGVPQTLEAERQLPERIDHLRPEAPNSAMNIQSPAEFYMAWLVTTEQGPVPKLSKAVQIKCPTIERRFSFCSHRESMLDVEDARE